MDYSVVHIWVRASKTDPFRSGVTIRMGATDDEFCPVRALYAYVRLRGPAAGPLFRFSDGTYLIRRHLDYLIRHGITANATLHTHSFGLELRVYYVPLDFRIALYKFWAGGLATHFDAISISLIPS